MNYYLLTWDYEAMIARHIVKGSGEMSPNQCSHLSKTGMETKKKKKKNLDSMVYLFVSILE